MVPEASPQARKHGSAGMVTLRASEAEAKLKRIGSAGKRLEARFRENGVFEARRKRPIPIWKHTTSIWKRRQALWLSGALIFFHSYAIDDLSRHLLDDPLIEKGETKQI